MNQSSFFLPMVLVYLPWYLLSQEALRIQVLPKHLENIYFLALFAYKVPVHHAS